MGSAVEVVISGGHHLVWWLVADTGGWTLDRDRRGRRIAAGSIEADTLWRLATGGTSREQAAQQTLRSGHAKLTEPFFEIVSAIR